MQSPLPLCLWDPRMLTVWGFLKIKLAPCARTDRLDGLTQFSSFLHHPVFPQLSLPHSPLDICSLDRLFRRLNVQFSSGLLTVLFEKHKQRMELVSFKQCITWLHWIELPRTKKGHFALFSLPNYTRLLQTIKLPTFFKDYNELS